MPTKLELIRGFSHVQSHHVPCALAMGNFDGVHLGHQALIDCLKKGALSRKLSPMVAVFEPQTAEFFLKEQAPARLMRLREKVKAIEALGIKHILVIPFTRALAEMPAEQFIQDCLLEKLNVRYLVAGHDFRFGYNRLGTLSLVHQLRIDTEMSDTCYLGESRDLKISSTVIRQALKEGDLNLAAQCLGRPFSLSGYVRPGDQRGRSIGFPTANVCLHRKNIPLSGVYAVKVLGIGNQRYGVANVGTRPTVDGTKTLLEVHLFNFNQSLYGRYIEIVFVHKLREEKRFDSFETLKGQIAQDVKEAQAYFLL